MRRIAAAVAGLSLLGLGARAADEKDEAKTEVKRNDDGTGHVKTTKKHKHGKLSKTSRAEKRLNRPLEQTL